MNFFFFLVTMLLLGYFNHLFSQDKPNIVLIMSDDQGWGDLSLHGNTNIQTPNIDRLAEQGARFERFYVAPLCAPTRAGLLTGRYHLRAGVIGVGGGEELMNLDEVTLADILNKAGYATGCFGKWHNGLQYPFHPNGRGFDEFFGFCSGNYLNYFNTNLEHNGQQVKSEGYIADVFTEKAMEFIAKNNSNISGKPFVCYVPYNTPHSPFQVPDEFYNQVKNRGISMIARAQDNESHERTIAALAMCENIDWNVGRVLTKLEELDLAKNTIVIYLSDNGPADFRWNGDMKGKKASVDEGGVRVPFFIRWPGHIPEGLVVKSSGAYIDILPTLADLVGISTKSFLPLDGVSLKENLTGNKDAHSDRISFSAINNMYAVRNGPYLKIRNELYNLNEDPGQRTDISFSQQEIYNDLSDTLQNWIKDVTAHIDSVRWLPVGYTEFPETRLDAQDAALHPSEKGNLSFGGSIRNGSYISNWDDTASYISWNIETHTTGKYEFFLDYTCSAKNVGSEFEIICGDKTLPGKITETYDPEFLPSPDRVERHQVYEKRFKRQKIGELKLDKGKYMLKIRAVKFLGNQVMDLNSVSLKIAN